MKNIGTVDRVIRVLLGLAILASYFVLEGNLRWLAVIGVIPIGTALVGFCPLYWLIGTNTCGLRRT